MFVLDQLEVDENTRGGDGDEGVDITNDGVQVEISARGASFIGTAGNDAETEVNASTEVPAADAAIALEV
jgi:hypothetical protein